MVSCIWPQWSKSPFSISSIVSCTPPALFLVQKQKWWKVRISQSNGALLRQAITSASWRHCSDQGLMDMGSLEQVGVRHIQGRRWMYFQFQHGTEHSSYHKSRTGFTWVYKLLWKFKFHVEQSFLIIPGFFYSFSLSFFVFFLLFFCFLFSSFPAPIG